MEREQRRELNQAFPVPGARLESAENLPAVRPILALPTLGPFDVIPRSLRRTPGFPFDQPGLEPTYLGRNAVWRAVRQLDLVGHEVLVPAYHHGVEVSALLDAGVKPKFVRVDASMRLDLEDLESRIGPRTRAIYVIHYVGFPQPLSELRALANRRGLLLIEDCALATFSRDGEVPLGSVGDASVFCFYKTVAVPHGGALLVREAGSTAAPGATLQAPPLLPTISHTLGSVFLTGERQLGRAGAVVRRWMRDVTHLARARAWEEDVPVGTQEFDREVVSLGMSRVTEWVLRRVDAEDVVRRRREHWLALHERLGDPRRSVWKTLPEGVCPLFYPIRVDDKDRALALLRSRGIEAIDFWRWHHPAVDSARFPEVDLLRREVVELPCHQDLQPEDVERIASAGFEALAS